MMEPTKSDNAMQMLAVRLVRGQDLRAALEDVLTTHNHRAGFVLQGIGSLSVAHLRYAGAERATELIGNIEILTLAGSLSPEGAHLHISVSDVAGQVMGGHVAAGCMVRTTAEILIGLLPDYIFARELDPDTGYRELSVIPASVA
jgi:predicted DNA-binding protein with PD1-like motif